MIKILFSNLVHANVISGKYSNYISILDSDGNKYSTLEIFFTGEGIRFLSWESVLG